MSTLLQSHLVFKKGAVLRHSDLNDIVDYMEGLVKASNRYLDGIGILRGFEVKTENDAQGRRTIKVDAGLAVTPGGQVIETTQPCFFYSTKPLDEDVKIVSECFDNAVELSTDPTNAQIDFTVPRCVLFLVEATITDPAKTSCFRQSDVNEKKNLTIRFFVGEAKPLPSLEPSCFATPCLPCFNGTDLVIESIAALNTLFTQKIQIGAAAIQSAIKLTTDCYPALFCEKPEDITILFPVNNAIRPFYDYNYLQTLVAAYNELIGLDYFKQTRYKYPFKTCPDMLHLGLFTNNCAIGNPCRHEWQPALSGTEGLEEALFYARRLVALTKVDNFDFTTPTTPTLTPSRSDMAPLSKRAIPFYLKEEIFRPLWNYQDTKQKTTGAIPRLSDAGCYMEGCDFVRVEGHIGKNIEELSIQALDFEGNLSGSILHTLRSKQNLPFQIKICTLGQAVPLGKRNIVPFMNYLAQHPGLKPLGGVPKGGTLVLVVAQENEPDAQTTVVGDFCLPYYDWFKEARQETTVAEFIVEAPNDFVITNGVYIFTVKEGVTSVSVFFKNISENADSYAWEVNGAEIVASTNELSFDHPFEVPHETDYTVQLTATRDQQSDTAFKTLRFVVEQTPEAPVIAEFIVEAPNDFAIDDGEYIFNVRAGIESVHIFFKSVSENADVFTWQVFKVGVGKVQIAQGNLPAFDYPDFNPSENYAIRLTARNAAQISQAPVVIEKTIRFEVLPEEEDKLIAQFVVEAPNDFELVEVGPMDIYTFPLEEQANNELEGLKVFFKSTSENATTFEWLVDDRPVANNKASDFDHVFVFSQNKKQFEVTLKSSNGANEGGITKIIQGIFADFVFAGGLPPGSIVTTDMDVEYKGVKTEKITILLTGPPQQNLAVRWGNRSVQADAYKWKLWNITVPNAPKLLDESNEPIDYTSRSQVGGSYVIELNAANQDSRMVSQKNILLDIEQPQLAVRPTSKESGKTATKNAAIESATTAPSPGNTVNHLRARHKHYREVLSDLGKKNALLAKTAGYKNAVAFLDSGDDLEQLQKSFKDLSLQFIRNVKLEGGIANEVYQTMLQNLIFYCFDKLSFMQQTGLSIPLSETLSEIFARIKDENTFSDLVQLKEAWHSNEIATGENTSVIQQLNAFFTIM